MYFNLKVYLGFFWICRVFCRTYIAKCNFYSFVNTFTEAKKKLWKDFDQIVWVKYHKNCTNWTYAGMVYLPIMLFVGLPQSWAVRFVGTDTRDVIASTHNGHITKFNMLIVVVFSVNNFKTWAVDISIRDGYFEPNNFWCGFV